jgi:threonine dehydrogenase-like Zn-dependent dehydrogenase
VENRKELARHFGADEVIDFEQRDAVEAIRELTDGAGVDASIEALGKQVTFEMCVKATSPGGTISNIGYHGDGDYVQIPRTGLGRGHERPENHHRFVSGRQGAHEPPAASARNRPRGSLHP